MTPVAPTDRSWSVCPWPGRPADGNLAGSEIPLPRRTMVVHIDEAKLETFLGQVLGDLAACYGGVMASLGDRLGLYDALAGAGPLSSAEVADRAGCAERYVREWLNSQVAAGYLEYDPQTERYTLPPEHAAVLTDPESPFLLIP